MPLLGYLGFPAFALECASLIAVSGAMWARMGGKGRTVATFLLAAFSGAMFVAIDSLTARSFVKILP